jgi:hypothetical protein
MKFYGDLDLNYSKLQEMLVDSQNGLPEPAKAGMVTHDVSDNVLYFCSKIDSSGNPVWIPLSNEIDYQVFTQSSASNVWTISHPSFILSSKSAVRVFNTSHSSVTPVSVDCSNPYTTVITLDTSMIGTAILLKPGDGIAGSLNDAAYIKFTPSGNMTSVSVQSALSELDNLKVSLTDVTASASANKILRLNSNGVLPASVTGGSGYLSTPRNVALTGVINGAADFDGSKNITITTTGIRWC